MKNSTNNGKSTPEENGTKNKCRKCDSFDVIDIVYGLPHSTTLEAANRGEISLGGCVVYPNQPEYKCKRCGFKW